MNVRTGFSRIRPSALPMGSWGLAVLLAAGQLVGCASDQLTEPDREPAGATDSRTQGELEASLAAAVPNTADAYVWANSPTSASYTPSTSYSFNRSGGAINITKPAGTTGRYRVRFTGLSALLGNKSTVKVTGYLPDNAYCKPIGRKVINDIVEVRCFNGTTGGAVNAYFTLVATRNYVELAFAHAHLQTSTNYAPAGNASWNPAGAMRVFRSGVGTYQVRFTGLGSRLGANGGHVQVVAVGGAAQHCKVRSWGGSPDLLVNVGCMRRDGTPFDIKFNVLFLMPNNHLGYAWAHSPSDASYTPSTFYSSNSGGGSIQITRSALGKYNVTFNNLGADLLGGGDVQVTAYGAGNAQCKVESWGTQNVNVRCFGPTGAAVDALFDVMFVS